MLLKLTNTSIKLRYYKAICVELYRRRALLSRGADIIPQVKDLIIQECLYNKERCSVCCCGLQATSAFHIRKYGFTGNYET